MSSSSQTSQLNSLSSQHSPPELFTRLSRPYGLVWFQHGRSWSPAFVVDTQQDLSADQQHTHIQQWQGGTRACVLPWLRPRGLVWCSVYALHAAPPAGVLATTNCHLTRQQRAELEQLAAATEEAASCAGRCAVANYQLRRLIQSLWATFDCISSTAFVDRGRQNDFWIALQAEFMQCRSYTSMVASLLHVFDAFDPKLHLPAAAAWRAEAVGAMQRTSMRQVESLCSKLVFGIVEASLLCVSDDKWTTSRKGLQRWNGQIIDWHAAPSPSTDDIVDVKLWGRLKREINENTAETLLVILPSSTGVQGGGGASPLALMPSIKSDSGGAAADGAAVYAVQTVRRENHKRLRQTQTPPLQTATPPQGYADIVDLVSPSQSDDDADAVMVTSEIGDAEHPIVVDSGDDVDFDVTPSHPDICKAARTGFQAVLQRRKTKKAALAQRNKAHVSAQPPVSPPAEGHALGSGNKLAIVALPQDLASTAALSSRGGLTASLQLIPVPPPPLRLPPPPERCLSDEQKAADHAAKVLNAHVLCTDLSRLYKDGGGDLERVPIPVLAQDPNHQTPPKFTYITKRFNVEAVAPADWRAFSTDCNCHGRSCGEDCCHIKYRDAEFPNDEDYNGVPLRGRLPYLPGQHGVCLYHQDSDSYLHECSAHCPCDMSCPMRVLQRGVTRQLALMPAENRGWGVFAVQNIPRGAFIAEYVGKLITDEEAENVSVDEYLFDVYHCSWGRDKKKVCLVVDASEKGNITRFLNHSCSPNVIVRLVRWESNDPQLSHLAFFALQDIPAGSELTINYSYAIDPKLPKVRCHCGAVKCRRFLRNKRGEGADGAVRATRWKTG